MDKQKIIEEYLNGIGVVELSKKYECHRSTIQRLLKRNGVVLRKSTPRLKYDINFFKTYTSESCYWAGFIAADGYVRGNRDTVHIKLSVYDYEFLNKFKKNINFSGNVKIRNEYCTIDISGKWFKNDLKENFNVVPNKTFNVCIPEGIPDEMVCHFVRGYFDGDGSITKTTCGTISFTSGSIVLLKQLQELFYNNGVRLKSKNKYPPIQRNVSITYSGKNAKLILDWMYNNSNEYMRMDRKYLKYIKLFKE